ncbi:MAG: hypothetical protein PHR26_01565 [Candidatus ainarchaeum sp.]|nr:hypothetical protein [Candidatus ainarchaeum sp.]MDD3975709.1 hypothetical protein [Candidatus ainarchaeum sp.]
MQKNNQLTNNENYLYNYIDSKKKNNILKNNDLKSAFKDYSNYKINFLLKQLKDKGYLLNLKKNNYIKKDIFSINDLFEIATNLYPGYISFSSALFYYGLIDYHPFNIYISTNKKSKNIKLYEYNLKYINTNFYNDFIRIDNIYISSLEKTIFDCFNKFKYIGSYSILSKAIYLGSNKINWNKLLLIYKKYSSKRQNQITGYILDILLKNTNLKIPNYFLKYLLSQDKSNTYLLNINNKKSKYIDKWKLKDNLGEKNIIDWWY